MITKIDIKKFGLYKDFRWPEGLQNFGRVNIIYGRNYAGKTTLSRIFDSVGQGQLHKDYLDGEFTLHTENDAVPFVTQSNMKDCPYMVRVYNADYVNRNLGWLKDEETGEIKPFALIGSENVEAQKAIDEIDAKLGSVEEKKGLLYMDFLHDQEYKKRKEALETSEQGLANKLKEKANGEIKRNYNFIKVGGSYTITNLKNDIEEVRKKKEAGRSILLSDDEAERLREIIKEAVKPPMRKLPETEPHLKEFVTAVKEQAGRKIALTQTLQELVENELLQKWVDEGRGLNRERETCAFCGNPITKGRWNEIDAHFSKESETLKNSLLELKAKQERAMAALDGFLEKYGITEDNIYIFHINRYNKAIERWNAYVTSYKQIIGELLMVTEERLSNLFKPVELGEISAETDNYMEIVKEINELVQLNNDYSEKQDGQKNSARDRLRQDAVYRFCLDIDYWELTDRLAKEKKELDDFWAGGLIRASEIGDLRERRKQKELEKKDEGKAAQKVTELLANHFGNGSLSLEPVTVVGPIVVGDPKASQQLRTKFVVKRGGQNAKNLSEGEKSLISFCYFIAQMTDELKGPDAGKLVVYIDDPISSLDSSHIFFMYSLIETVFIKKICFGQLFISTHNLEFLKFMKRIRPKVTEGCKTKCHYVVVKLGKGTTDDYKSEIRQMPEYLSKYMTEYNYLFEQIYEIAMLDREEEQTLYGEKYTQYYNIGNNMRKFLECYLFNRYPNADEPLAAHLADLFDNHVPSEVNRVVNEYSHLVWSERGMRVMDAPEVVAAAREILKVLQTKDKVHYDTLCKSVKVDEKVIF